MKILDENQLLFPDVKVGKFVLYSCGSKVGEILLPTAGITYFPPEPQISDGEMSIIFRMRFDFLDGDGMEILRRIVQFYYDDTYKHKLRFVIPGDSKNGYEVEPYGNWRAWFLDDEPIGYGPVEAQFISAEIPKAAQEVFSNTEPWVVE